MSSVIFFTLTMFLVLSSGLIISFGVSVPSISNQLQGPINCDINNLPQSVCQFPQWSPPKAANATASSSGGTQTPLQFGICILTIGLLCQGSIVETVNNVGQAIYNFAAFFLYGFAFFGNIVIVFFNKLIQGIFLVFAITQLMSTDFNIPFLQYIWLGILIFYVMYGISMLKPGGSGMS